MGLVERVNVHTAVAVGTGQLGHEAVDPLLGVAVSAMEVPSMNACEGRHGPGLAQVRPEGELVTVPLPEPGPKLTISTGLLLSDPS